MIRKYLLPQENMTVTAAETLIGSIHSGAKDYYNNPGEEAKKEDKKEEETSSESEPETSSETE